MIVAVLYLVVFNAIEHFRNRKGPWEVAFSSGTNAPAIIIDQPRLNIRNVKILLPSADTNAVDATNIYFDQARPVPFAVPFGQCVGLDTITMPGTVALKLQGHAIQLLPRVLTIDGREVAWQSGATITLVPK